MVKWMRYRYPKLGYPQDDSYTLYHAAGQDGLPVCGRGTKNIRLGGDRVEVLENVEGVDMSRLDGLSREFCCLCTDKVGPVRPLTEEESKKREEEQMAAAILLYNRIFPNG